MEEYDEPSGSAATELLQKPQQAQKELTLPHPSDWRLSDTKKCERICITHIHASMHAACELRRLPVAFYVLVEVDGNITKTPNKPLLLRNNAVEWDGEIFLPLVLSSIVSFNVYLSFEFGPRLRNGELICELKTSVGEILDQNERLEAVKFRALKGEECFSLRIVTERRNEMRLELSESNALRKLEQVTSEGHRALRCYRQRQNQIDLSKAITCFENVLEMCPLDHPNRPAAVFDLARAKFIHHRANNHDIELDVPISLYRDTFRLRTTHQNHSMTALDLTFALFSHFRKRGGETDTAEVTNLLASVVALSSVESYVYRAALLVLQIVEISFTTHLPRIDPTEDMNSAHLVQRVRATLLGLSERSPLRATIYAGLGCLLYLRFHDNEDLADLNEGISMLGHAVQLTPNCHADKPGLIGTLGSSLLSRFERLGDVVDLDKSLLMFPDAARLVPGGHPNVLDALWRPASRGKHVPYGDLVALHSSISVFEEVVSLTPDIHAVKPLRLHKLANSLSTRFECLGDFVDLDKSIRAFEEAIHLTPHKHPTKPDLLNKLWKSLFDCFERLSNLPDLDKSISILENALPLISDDHPDKSAVLGNLRRALSCRFERLGNLADLAKSVLIFENEVHLTTEGHPNRPNELGLFENYLSSCFERLGNFTCLVKSISLLQVCPGPDDHLLKLHWFDNVRHILLGRFERFGCLADLDKSISVNEEAIQLIPDGHPDKPSQLNYLWSTLLQRFNQLGDPADLDQSISHNEKAIRLVPDGHPNKPAWLHNLGISLITRFDCLGDVADITKSVSVTEEAVSLTPDGHPDKPGQLHSLGSSLSHRFERLGDVADITKSVSAFEEAVSLSPDDHPDKPNRLGSLGNSLSSRFECLGNVTDITESISMLEQAVRLSPDGHANKSSWLNNLGKSLSSRFECFGDVADITKTILIFDEAVRLTPDGHSDKPSRLNNLGRSFMTRFNHFHDSSDLSAAILRFSAVAQCCTSPTLIRFQAACHWVSSAQVEGNCQALLVAYTATLGLFPLLAWMDLSLTTHHRLLVDAAGVARDAAAAALEAGYPEMAVEWLEQGRLILWTQILQLRNQMDLLRVTHPAIAEEFEQTSKVLESAGSRVHLTSQDRLNNLNLDFRSLEAQRYHTLALRRQTLLSHIRSLPGFDRFLLPKTIEQLASLATTGPVIYLNASTARCDALIIMAELENVIPVPLSGVTYRRVELMRRLLLLGRGRPTVQPTDDVSLLTREGGIIRRVEDILHDRFQQILEFLWCEVVNPVLDALGFSTPPSEVEKIPRIFWCPTGPFAFLPIHAAGIYDTSTTGSKLSDFAISTYIPTLEALTPLIDKGVSGNPSNIRLVTVAQPLSDGKPRLPNVLGEIDHIQQLSQASSFVTLHDSKGTAEDVMEKMASSNWVHFACHGIQDPVRPLESGLCLANDRRLRLSDIVKLPRRSGGLAFLSACQTAMGDEKRSEESLHLAAGMFLAGYSGVIATMGSIKDIDAPKVARDVYKHLFRDGKVPDVTEAAEALHRAVMRLRDEDEAPFSSWVPFIHVGR